MDFELLKANEQFIIKKEELKIVTSKLYILEQ
jgi:hypothetical protein